MTSMNVNDVFEVPHIFSRTCSIGKHFFKANNGNARTMCEISLKLTVKIPENVIYLVIMSFLRCSGVCIVDFKQVNAGWDDRFNKD